MGKKELQFIVLVILYLVGMLTGAFLGQLMMYNTVKSICEVSNVHTP